MCELEDFSTGTFHDEFIKKYAESPSQPTLDFYISDSLQDMLDVDICTEIANIVNGGNCIDGDYEFDRACIDEVQSSFDKANDGFTLQASFSGGNLNNSSYNAKETCDFNNADLTPPQTTTTTSTNSSSFWFGSGNDIFADVGACVNPASVMPLISPTLSQNYVLAKVNHVKSPTSPNINDIKSHLSFSPAHIKSSTNSLRNEQLTSHRPKQQIVAISSNLTSATTAPATLATNSVLQRKVQMSSTISPATTINTAAEVVKKDLNCEIRKLSDTTSQLENNNYNKSNFIGTTSNTLTSVISKSSGNTIKLGSGIGSLTFAHNLNFSKMKQMTGCVKSSLGSSSIIMTNHNNSVLLNRDRSPSQNNNSNNNKGPNVTQILTQRSTSSPIFGYASRPSMQRIQHQQQHQTLSGGDIIRTDSGCIPKLVSECVRQDINRLSNEGQNIKASPSLSLNGVCGMSNNGGITVKSFQQKNKPAPSKIEQEYPKPAYSYSCLIAMALKNSRRGLLPVSEIYSFMCEHFPYFKTAPSGWKNSVRHNLSLNKCFEKIEKPPTNGYQRKGCLWAMNPDRIAKMDEEVQKWSRKDPLSIRNAMVFPEHLEALERGEMKHGSTGDSDAEIDSQSDVEEASDLEETELDETLIEEPMLAEEECGIDRGKTNHNDISDDHASIPKNDNSILLITENNTNQQKTNTADKVNEYIMRNNLRGLGSNTMSIKLNTPDTTNSILHNFDNEVEDIYDAIDIEDDQDTACNTANNMDIIELNPSDYDTNVMSQENENHQTLKRARLNIDCTTILENENEKKFKQEQQQHQQQLRIFNTQKMIKVRSISELQMQQQAKSTENDDVMNTINNFNTQQKQPRYTSVIGLSNLMNRRKMQMHNRIA